MELCTMPITDLEIRRFKSREKLYTLSEGIQMMVNLMKGIIHHKNGGNYLSKSAISRTINSRMNYDLMHFLSGYGAPVVSSTNNHSGGTINQTNHHNITAGGVDAHELVRRIKQEQSEDIHQALGITMTEKF